MPHPLPVGAAMLALFLSWPLSAQEIDLAAHIAPGKWALAYQRTGTFKPLRLKHKESGVSHTCLNGDPRRQIQAWITAKGCTVGKESMQDGVYHLEGHCTLRWWAGHAIPVSVDLRPENRKSFRMIIRTSDDSPLGFEEDTAATHEGICDKSAPSAIKGKQDKRA